MSHPPPPSATTANFRSLGDWQASSLAALDTVTTIVVDVVDCHHRSSSCPGGGAPPTVSLDATPPNHMYIVRAALRHIRTRPRGDEHGGGGGAPTSPPPWPETAEPDLRRYLDKFCRRWGCAREDGAAGII